MPMLQGSGWRGRSTRVDGGFANAPRVNATVRPTMPDATLPKLIRRKYQPDAGPQHYVDAALATDDAHAVRDRKRWAKFLAERPKPSDARLTDSQGRPVKVKQHDAPFDAGDPLEGRGGKVVARPDGVKPAPAPKPIGDLNPELGRAEAHAALLERRESAQATVKRAIDRVADCPWTVRVLAGALVKIDGTGSFKPKRFRGITGLFA